MKIGYPKTLKISKHEHFFQFVSQKVHRDCLSLVSFGNTAYRAAAKKTRAKAH